MHNGGRRDALSCPTNFRLKFTREGEREREQLYSLAFSLFREETIARALDAHIYTLSGKGKMIRARAENTAVVCGEGITLSFLVRGS